VAFASVTMIRFGIGAGVGENVSGGGEAMQAPSSISGGLLCPTRNWLCVLAVLARDRFWISVVVNCIVWCHPT
jgi:hypothetical protein